MSQLQRAHLRGCYPWVLPWLMGEGSTWVWHPTCYLLQVRISKLSELWAMMQGSPLENASGRHVPAQCTVHMQHTRRLQGTAPGPSVCGGHLAVPWWTSIHCQASPGKPGTCLRTALLWEGLCAGYSVTGQATLSAIFRQLELTMNATVYHVVP